MKITISQEGTNPISITVPDNKQEIKSQEGIKSTIAIGSLTSTLSNIGDLATGFTFKSITELRKSDKVKSFLATVRKAAAESGGVVRAISQAELIRLDPKYFGKHNTFEIDGITVARFNSTNMVGVMFKKYTYKMYIIMYDNVKKQLLTKRFATIKP